MASVHTPYMQLAPRNSCARQAEFWDAPKLQNTCRHGCFSTAMCPTDGTSDCRSAHTVRTLQYDAAAPLACARGAQKISASAHIEPRPTSDLEAGGGGASSSRAVLRPSAAEDCFRGLVPLPCELPL